MLNIAGTYILTPVCIASAQKIETDACVVRKDTTRIPKLDEQGENFYLVPGSILTLQADPQYIIACYCNEGEEPQRIQLADSRPHTAGNPLNGCPFADLVIKKVNGIDFTYFCDTKLSSDHYQNQTAELALECATWCATETTCWGSEWVNGTCRFHAEKADTTAIYGKSTVGWIAMIKNNATAIQRLSDEEPKPEPTPEPTPASTPEPTPESTPESTPAPKPVRIREILKYDILSVC